MIIFGRTQDCYGTPFDPSDPDAIAAGITSDNAQAAIIEAKTDALNNDRYPVFFYYSSGNANTGRRLEVWQGIPTSTAPFQPPEDSQIKTIFVGTGALNTGTIRFYNATTATTIVDIDFTAQTQRLITGAYSVSALDDIEIYVLSGSFNKPFGVFWMNTVT